MSKTNFEDIQEFHRKFGILTQETVVQLDTETFDYRFNFLHEELEELRIAWLEGNVPDQIDALVDLSVVTLGTADIMGVFWQLHWDEVQRANMSKERASSANDPRSKRKSSLDIVKPIDWIGPDHVRILKGE